MATQKISVRCSTCDGTGIESKSKDENGNPIQKSCAACAGDGWLDTGMVDSTEISTKIDAIQSSVNQVAEMVKEEFEYIQKIYKIVSKGK